MFILCIFSAKYNAALPCSSPADMYNGIVGNQHNLFANQNKLFVLLQTDNAYKQTHYISLYQIVNMHHHYHLTQIGKSVYLSKKSHIDGPNSNGIYFINNQPYFNVGYQYAYQDDVIALALGTHWTSLSQYCYAPMFVTHIMHWKKDTFHNIIPTQTISHIKLLTQQTIKGQSFHIERYKGNHWQPIDSNLILKNIDSYYFYSDGLNSVYLMLVQQSNKQLNATKPNKVISIYHFISPDDQ